MKLALFTLLTLTGVALAEPSVWTLHSSDPVKTTAYNATGELPKGGPDLSSAYTGVVFSGRYANYTKADTWYPTWAADGNLYSPWTDGTIGPEMRFVWSGAGKGARTGYATIKGDDPLGLEISNWGIMNASATPFQGRYPCGSLHHNGVWYYGTYGIDQPNKELKNQYGWYVMGPFAGFHWSTDNGKTWNLSPHSTANPLFEEPTRDQTANEVIYSMKR